LPGPRSAGSCGCGGQGQGRNEPRRPSRKNGLLGLPGRFMALVRRRRNPAEDRVRVAVGIVPKRSAGPGRDIGSHCSGILDRLLVLRVSDLARINVEDDRAAAVLLPFCCGGKRSASRSIATWLSVPGSSRLSLVLLPNVRTSKTTAKARTTREPTTTHFRRAANIPSPCRNAP
jgi:hypothetical protein